MTDHQKEEETTQTENAKPNESVHAAGNMDQNKIFAILGYIIPILFFVPLISEGKNNAYARFHANQQLNLLLLEVVGQLVLSALIITVILLPVLYVVILVLVIMGVINASNGLMKPLPVIGKIQLIK